MPINTPTRDLVIMGAVKGLAAASPDFTGIPIWIQQLFTMTTGDGVTSASFPALHLSEGKQSYRIITNHGYHGTLPIYADVYDRWEEDNALFDTHWATCCTLTENLRGILESNPTLTYQNVALALDGPVIELSEYDEPLRRSIAGIDFMVRRLTATWPVLPYDT